LTSVVDLRDDRRGLTLEKRMKTSCSVVAILAMSMAFSAVVAGVGQEKIPELQKPRPDLKGDTLTGCVARGTSTDTYTLTGITKEGAPTAKDAAQRMAVVLSATDVDLSKHVGHRVSVTGSLASEPRPLGTAGTEKPAATVATAEGEQKPLQTFTVTALKMIAASCSQPS
jgi:hypothetical protein